MYHPRLAAILAALISLALLVASCARNQSPTPEAVDTASIGTAERVAFQPPIGKDKVATGNFDPDVSLNIVIFRLDSNEAVASFSTANGTIKVEHEPGVTEHYGANWHSRRAGLPNDTSLRIEVRLGIDTGAGPICNITDISRSPGCMAFADVVLVKAPPKKPLKDFFYLKNGETLPIKVHVEKPAANLPPGTGTSITGTIPSTGGTLELTGVGSVIFPSGTFSTARTITLFQISEDNALADFWVAGHLFGVTKRAAYELHVNIGNALPNSDTIGVTLNVPQVLLDGLEEGHGIGLFVQLEQGDEGESLSTYEPFEFTFNNATRLLTATIPTWVFAPNKDDGYEVGFLLAAGPTVTGTATQADSLNTATVTGCLAYSRPGTNILEPGPLQFAFAIGCPLGNCRVNDLYGARLDPGVRMHHGLDLRTRDGNTTVYAVANGQIERVRYQAGEVSQGLSKENPSYSDFHPPNPEDGLENKARAAGARGAGLYIVLRHDDGSATQYFHLDPETLAPNAVDISYADFDPRRPIRVTKGQRIAIAGQTGGTVPHLHLEYTRARDIQAGRIDPLACLENVEPIVEIASPTSRPLEMSAEAGKTVTSKFTLRNNSRALILFENTTASNAPAVTVTNPTAFINKEATKDLDIKGTCPTDTTNFNGSGTLSTTFFKRLENGTKAWPIPTILVDPYGVVPKREDLSVMLSCETREREYIGQFTREFVHTSDAETYGWWGYTCDDEHVTNGTTYSTSENRFVASVTVIFEAYVSEWETYLVPLSVQAGSYTGNGKGSGVGPRTTDESSWSSNGTSDGLLLIDPAGSVEQYVAFSSDGTGSGQLVVRYVGEQSVQTRYTECSVSHTETQTQPMEGEGGGLLMFPPGLVEGAVSSDGSFSGSAVFAQGDDFCDTSRCGSWSATDRYSWMIRPR